MKTTKEQYKKRRVFLTDLLRSGRYNQIKGYLRREGKGFCWSGVACDAYDILNKVQSGWSMDECKFWLYRSHTVMPIEVRDYFGFKTQIGEFIKKKKNGKGHIRTSLVKMNDTGSDFFEIADVIEEEPKNLFVN